MTKRSWAVTVTALAFATAVGGCTTASPGPQPTLASSTTPRSTTASPSTSASPSTQSAEEKQIAAAEATVRAFIKLQDNLAKTTSLSINELHKVTRGTAFDTWSREAQLSRAKGWRQVGDTTIVAAAGVIAAAKPRTTVKTTICYDVSQVQVVDRTGKSVVSKERANRARATYTVEQYSDGWFITDDDTRGEPCAA